MRDMTHMMCSRGAVGESKVIALIDECVMMYGCA